MDNIRDVFNKFRNKMADMGVTKPINEDKEAKIR